jgi:phosphatidylserine/phosphatidylglycerophosphate/cardiolipin synthase-like enzyme
MVAEILSVRDSHLHSARREAEMAQDVSTIKHGAMTFYFQSKRAGIDGKASAHLVDFIHGAKKSLDVAIYDLKESSVLQALLAVANAGHVKLRIRYDATTGSKISGSSKTVDPKPPTTAAVKSAGLGGIAEPISDKGGHLMHNKFLVRDGKTVWSGSGNFTNGGLHLQDNNYFVIESSKAAAAYQAIFDGLKMAGHGPAIHPSTITLGDVKLSIFSSTQAKEIEGIETTVIKALKGAKTVRIMAMLVSDPGILQALFDLKNQDIKGVLDPHEMKQVMMPPHGKSHADPKLFWFANGDARFVAAPSHAFSKNDQNDFMHNKVMIINNKTVVAGSYNFSENAETNDENLVVIESPVIAAAYTRYFDALFKQYKAHGAHLPPQ